jgi:hypothetical protein
MQSLTAGSVVPTQSLPYWLQHTALDLLQLERRYEIQGIEKEDHQKKQYDGHDKRIANLSENAGNPFKS